MFIANPGHPPTNNGAEQALRQVVISRWISFGTLINEGNMHIPPRPMLLKYTGHGINIRCNVFYSR